MKNIKTPLSALFLSTLAISFSSYADTPVANAPIANNQVPTANSTIAPGAVSTPTPTVPPIAAASYVLMDYYSGHIIAEQRMNVRRHPASLTKMLTSYVIGQEMNAGHIQNDQVVTISEKAWAKNFPDSSKMFLEVGKEVTVGELNQGIIVASGNDACVAMAEHIAGSEEGFVTMMNDWAARIGMNNSLFVNSHGLDSDVHYSTAYDLAILGQALIRDVPDEYALYAQKDFTYNGIKQSNRNSLLWDKSMQVDGIKTGHTSGAGYNLVTSAVDGDMRLVAVVMGTASENARKAESKKLLNYGFRSFETISPNKAGDTIVNQKIWMGEKNEINLGVTNDVYVTIPRNQAANLTSNYKLDTTLKAPVQEGDVVGKVYYQLDGKDIAEFSLVAKETVEKGGFFSRLWDYLVLLVTNLF